jgi:hypothetical protein
MHSLITVDDDIPTLSANTTNTSTTTTDHKGSSTINNIHTNIAQKSSSSSSSSSGNGLIAWWTFEDGVGSMRVTDVTGHRYKTPIHQRFDKDKTPATTTTTNTTSNIISINTAATVANSDSIVIKASDSSKAQGKALEQETAARYY